MRVFNDNASRNIDLKLPAVGVRIVIQGEGYQDLSDDKRVALTPFFRSFDLRVEPSPDDALMENSREKDPQTSSKKEAAEKEAAEKEAAEKEAAAKEAAAKEAADKGTAAKEAADKGTAKPASRKRSQPVSKEK